MKIKAEEKKMRAGTQMLIEDENPFVGMTIWKKLKDKMSDVNSINKRIVERGNNCGHKKLPMEKTSKNGLEQAESDV